MHDDDIIKEASLENGYTEVLKKAIALTRKDDEALHLRRVRRLLDKNKRLQDRIENLKASIPDRVH